MIGRRIQSRRGISWGGVFFAMIGLALIAASVAEKKVDFAIGAILETDFTIGVRGVLGLSGSGI